MRIVEVHHPCRKLSKVDGTSHVDRRAMGSGKEGYQALALASILPTSTVRPLAG